MFFTNPAALPDGFFLQIRGWDGKPIRIVAKDESAPAPAHNALIDAVVLVTHPEGLIFDFSNAADYCGGAITQGPPSATANMAALSTECDRRAALIDRRSKLMNALGATLGPAIALTGGHGLHGQPLVNAMNYQDAPKIGGVWQPQVQSPFDDNVVYPAEAVQAATGLFGSVCNRFGKPSLDMLVMLQHCSFLYKNHQWAPCLVLAWSVSELILNRLWSEALDKANITNGGPTAINSDRRQRLKGISYTASVMTEMLSLLGMLADKEREYLDEVRKRRNSFVHSLSDVSQVDAGHAVGLACRLIDLEIGKPGFRITLTAGYRE